MEKRVVIGDFDGTVTDAEKEAIPFCEGCRQDLAALTGIPLKEVQLLLKEYEGEIQQNPTAYAWERGGHKVAPSVVDPYIRMWTATQELFKARGLFTEAKERDAVLDKFFKDNYKKSNTCFRPGAREALDALSSAANLYVVTNSSTDAVRGKLAALGTKLPPHKVLGEAKKYEIDGDWDQVPESLSLPGLDRPVLLRRKKYFNILNQIRFWNEVEWEDITVFGDIVELDLALAWVLGCRIALLANEFTPAYEVSFLKSQDPARVTVVRSLADAVSFALA